MDAAVDDLEEEASRHRTAVGARKGQAGVPRCSEAALTLLALASTACRGGGGLTSLVRAYLDRIAGRPSHQGGSESTVGAFLAPGAAVQATVALKTCPELFGVPNEALLVGYEAVAVACLEAGAWAADQGCTRGKAGKQVEKAVRTALKPVLEKLQMLLSRGRGVGSVRGDFGEALERICGPYRGKMGKLVGKLERELLGDQGGERAREQAACLVSMHCEEVRGHTQLARPSTGPCKMIWLPNATQGRLSPCAPWARGGWRRSRPWTRRGVGSATRRQGHREAGR